MDRVAKSGEVRALQRRFDESPCGAPGIYEYAAAWDGFIDIPPMAATAYVAGSGRARVVIDGQEVAKTGPPFAQVCSSPGNAVRYDRGSMDCAPEDTRSTWRACTRSVRTLAAALGSPSLPLTDVPPAAYSHQRKIR